MKRLIATFISICMTFPTIAGPNPDDIHNMKSWCECVMQGGACRVENDTKVYTPGQRIFTSAGPISAEIYNAIRKQGGLMCVQGEQSCTSAWDGENCVAFRRMFRRESMVCVRPGDPIRARR